MNSFTTSDGVQYEIDELGIIHQLNPAPYKYDANYVATYDTEAYRRDNDRLQAMRYAFAVACHGHTPGKIFDYGCGNLAFVNYARQSSWAVGYDITGLPGTVTELQDYHNRSQIFYPVCDRDRQQQMHSAWPAAGHCRAGMPQYRMLLRNLHRIYTAPG
jgi:hypothetical protein